MAVKLSALRISSALLPRNMVFLLLILIFVKDWVMQLEGLGELKRFIHLIGSRTRDLLLVTYSLSYRGSKINPFELVFFITRR
jgi:hypothetical protein